VRVYWFCRSRLFEWREQKRVERLFYGSEPFRHMDQILLSAYQEQSPYEVSKAFLQSRGAADPYLYGETPLTTLYTVAKAFQITSEDTLLELGAGRFRGAFFLTEVIGCRVVGIEQIPRFTRTARALSHPRLQVVEGDFFTADFSAATVVYLYGLHLTDSQQEHLVQKLQQLGPAVKILTVSAPLPGCAVIGCVEGRFPWGKTEIYAQFFQGNR
jgi:hypothetical protein